MSTKPASPGHQPPQDPSRDPPLFAFFTEIGIIAQLSGAAFDRVLPDGMTRSQFSLLNHLVRLGGPRSLVELARSFQVTKGAMTNTTSKLAAKGLIRISPDPKDGRGKLVDITEAGRAMRQTCLDSLGPMAAVMQRALPPEEIGPLIEPLQKVRRWLDENREIGAPGPAPDRATDGTP